MTLTTKTLRLTALEDISYRLGSSYPKEGFPIKNGQSILILDDALKLLQVRKLGTKQRGRFKTQELS